MFQRLNGRTGHYALLLLVGASLFLPNLGDSSLWDIDEGNNAEAAREMMESGNWIVPTFNYQLRTDKPALLYWMQIAGYRLFGVGEFAARFPSTLAALVTLLVTYELGRRLFDPGTGLIAGLMVGSTVMGCMAAHFANPDALLNALTVLTFLLFWQSYTRGAWVWFGATGICMGFAVLAKGPVGLVLPLGTIVLFLMWSRQLRWLLNRRLVLGTFAFLLVALPWYALVGAETKGEFLRGFFLTHHVQRFRSTMEGHGGFVFYYLVILLVGFAPWSMFIGPTAWYGFRSAMWGEGREDTGTGTKGQAIRDRYRFLLSWIFVYLVSFSLSATKLPNYILPIYPSVALLTARYLERWRQQTLVPNAWVVRLSLTGLALVGVGVMVGFLVAGGKFGVPTFHGRRLLLPGAEIGAVFGIVPILGALVAAWLVRRQPVGIVLAGISGTAILFIGTVAAWGGLTVEAFKGPKMLVEAFQAQRTEREIQIASYGYDQPSVVFYCRHEVKRLENDEKVLEFLRFPVPVYLLVPVPLWGELETRVRGPHRLLGRHYDLYRNSEIVVVTNR